MDDQTAAPVADPNYFVCPACGCGYDAHPGAMCPACKATLPKKKAS